MSNSNRGPGRPRAHMLHAAILAAAGVGGSLEREARRILLAHCMAHQCAGDAAAAWMVTERTFRRTLHAHGTNWQRSIIDLGEHAWKEAA